MNSPTVPLAPHAVPVEGCAPFGLRYALVDEVGGLVRPPDLTEVGAWHTDGRGGFIAPAADLAGTWGYMDGYGSWLAEPTLQHATGFDEGLSRFMTGGLWGYADPSGTEVLAARFLEAGPFTHGLAAVRGESGAGHIDPNGTFVTDPVHRAAGRYGPNGLAGVRTVDGRCGYVDREGRLAIAARFDRALPFNAAGTAPVLLGEAWGLIDATGAWVVEPCFRRLDAFDENGLAYAVGGTAGDMYIGFVDPYGKVVVRQEGEMDSVLRCGLLKVGDEYSRGFRDATGAWAIEDEYEWTDRFDAGGAAVARPLDPPVWGVLRSDGSFTPVAHPEPLTDSESWITGFDGGHGTAPFLTPDGGLVHVGRDGRDVCRVEVDAPDRSAIALRNAAGTTVWRGTAAPGTFEHHRPFLAEDVRAFIDHTTAWEGDLGEVVRDLMALPPREFRPTSLIFDGNQDPYDLTDLDDYDRADTEQGAVLVLASTWLAAEWLTEYPWLEDGVQDCFTEILETYERRLCELFGTQSAELVHCLRGGDGEWQATWEVEGRHLVLQYFLLIGDGDRELQVWLAVVEA
ncbi:WG repeat-containing protein [Streptomyces sp. NPDC057939]|uniref:WG repeat-containing protein n=1 Tax=Streptomyces sp. NPDC057939 TaxID=3346284 RepID=UPI0036E1C59D